MSVVREEVREGPQAEEFLSDIYDVLHESMLLQARMADSLDRLVEFCEPDGPKVA